MRLSKLALVIILLMLMVPSIYGFGRSCNFRCNEIPSIIDYMDPRGCSCHNDCGTRIYTLRCCHDQRRLCGPGGSQACMIPRKVSGADVVGIKKLFYRIGEQITYECRFRYVLEGQSTRTCIMNGVWSPGPPECRYEIYVCRPPSVSNGGYSVKKKQYLKWESVRIWCNNGYELQGPSRITCRSFSWSGPYTRCIKDRCAKKTCSADATCTNYLFSSRCKCNAGFEGDGLICKEDRCATMICSADATCTNSLFSSRCKCNGGFEGDGRICTRIPCFKHTCKTDENCIDAGRGNGQYTCECKKGFKKVGGECLVFTTTTDDPSTTTDDPITTTDDPTTTTAAPTSTTEDPTTTPIATTAKKEPTRTASPTTDPCLSWPAAHSCRYQVFSGTVTWNEAKSRCESMCSSKLAHQNIRTVADLNFVLGVITYDNASMWVGLTDVDSEDTSDPHWDQTDPETTLDFAGRYATIAGTPGCGFYSVPQVPLSLYSFETCSATNTSTPTRYLCEACLP